jgi:basic membrane protein A
VAGATHIAPAITIAIDYISAPPDYSGFDCAACAETLATGMYNEGADVIYHAAGDSGAGLFAAAKFLSEGGSDHFWAIGVDVDEYEEYGAAYQPHILTSMLKRYDTATYLSIERFLAGNLQGGYPELGLAEHAVGYATSGGYLDAITARLDELAQAIVGGDIVVPEAP